MQNLQTRHNTRSLILGTAANEGSDAEHKSGGLSGRMLRKPRLVLMRQLDVATRSTGLRKDQMSLVRSLIPSSTACVHRSAHLLPSRTVNI